MLPGAQGDDGTERLGARRRAPGVGAASGSAISGVRPIERFQLDAQTVGDGRHTVKSRPRRDRPDARSPRRREVGSYGVDTFQARRRPIAMAASVKDVAAAAGVSLGHRLQRAQPARPGQRRHPGPGGAGDGRARLRPQRVAPASCAPGRSRTLAYVMLDATNPFFTDVAAGIEEAAEQPDLLAVPVQQRPARRAREHLPRPARAAARAGHPGHPGRPASPPCSTSSAPRHPGRHRRPHPSPERPLHGRGRRRARRPARRRAPARPRPRADRLHRRARAHRPGARPSRRRPRRRSAEAGRARRRPRRARRPTRSPSPRGAAAGERLAGLPQRGPGRPRPSAPTTCSPSACSSRPSRSACGCPRTSRSSATTTSSSRRPPPSR